VINVNAINLKGQAMIELNGIYKLKHIKGLNSNTDNNFKVISINKEHTMVYCEQLDGLDAGEKFVFMIECLLDPEKPDDIYFGEIIRKD
jgi:endo-alpha-1,4-polygalactosaminidase (GH114 family)